jgi:hypothetical protein
LLKIQKSGMLRHMALGVHIPEHGAARYSLYAKGMVLGGTAVPGRGTFLSFEGVVRLFYSYPRHRRAYIVRPIVELKCHQGRRLPGVQNEVGVLYEARGRRIDILRKVYYHLEKINGPEVYRWDALFWQKIGCLLDCKMRFRERKTAAGEYKRSYTHKANKANLLRLSKAYLRSP